MGYAAANAILSITTASFTSSNVTGGANTSVIGFFAGNNFTFTNMTIQVSVFGTTNAGIMIGTLTTSVQVFI